MQTDTKTNSFLQDLSELTLKHGIAIVPHAFTNDPILFDLDPNCLEHWAESYHADHAHRLIRD